MLWFERQLASSQIYWQLHQTIIITNLTFLSCIMGSHIECHTLRATWQITKTTMISILVHTKYTIKSYKVGLCTLTSPSSIIHMFGRTYLCDDSTIHTIVRAYLCDDWSLREKLRIFTLTLCNWYISMGLHLMKWLKEGHIPIQAMIKIEQTKATPTNIDALEIYYHIQWD